MAFVPVPKDLTRVKTKIAFNLTKRQLICFSIAGAVGIPLYLLTKGLLGTSTSAVIMVIVMLPFFFVALYEKDGRPFERIAINFIRVRFLRPRTRIYKTENIYFIIEQESKRLEVNSIEKATETSNTRAKTKPKQGSIKKPKERL